MTRKDYLFRGLAAGLVCGTAAVGITLKDTPLWARIIGGVALVILAASIALYRSSAIEDDEK